jgi:hypothetical protein
MAIGSGYQQPSITPPANGLIVEGNVGIGIDTPTAPLQVKSSDPAVGNIWIGRPMYDIAYDGGTDAYFLFVNYGAEATGKTSFISSISGESLAIYNDGRVYIPKNNVGIGTTTAGSRLVVKGAGNTNTTSSLNVTNNNNNSLLFVRNDGSVGIGTATP